MRILMLVLLIVTLAGTTTPFAATKHAATPSQNSASAGISPAGNTSDTQQKPVATPPVLPADNSAVHPLPTHAGPPPAEPAPTMKDMAEILSRHMNFMTYGFAVLAVFAGILAILGAFLPYFTTRTFRAQIKEKQAQIDLFRRRMEEYVAEAKKYCKTLADMVAAQGATQTFSNDIVRIAQDKAQNGSGTEVLWGKAILAQENKDWETALTFWTSILENEQHNDSALRGAPQKSDRCDSYSTRRGEHTCPSERIMPRLSRPEWP